MRTLFDNGYVPPREEQEKQDPAHCSGLDAVEGRIKAPLWEARSGLAYIQQSVNMGRKTFEEYLSAYPDDEFCWMLLFELVRNCYSSVQMVQYLHVLSEASLQDNGEIVHAKAPLRVVNVAAMCRMMSRLTGDYHYLSKHGWKKPELVRDQDGFIN